jgi:hypothetical protein
VQLTAVGNADSAYGFSHWSGDYQGSDNPLSLFLNAPKTLVAHFSKGRVIVASEPTGLKLTVDGEEVVAPVVFNWLPNEVHQIGAISPQGDEIETKYVFSHWSDGGGQEHDITVTDDLVTYTAVFDATYFLKIESEFGTPVGEGWYSKGTQVPVTIDSVVLENGNIQRRFVEWIGTGNGSVSSTTRNITVTLNGPVVEKALWEPQFKLTVRTNPRNIQNAEVNVTPEGPWYDPGTEVTLEVVVTDTGTTFLNWGGAVSDTANPISITMNSPMEIIANFDTPNKPPQILGMPDLSIMEDGILLYSFTWLGQYVTDPNDPPEWLEWDFDGNSHVTVNVNTDQGEVRFIPEANWNGIQEMTLTVTDPAGETDSDTFTVVVIAVPDPPGPFELVSPSQDSVITDWESSTLSLNWAMSSNVDIGDEITYSFYFSLYPDLIGQGTIQVSAITDTQVQLLPRPDGVYYWGVRAQDKQGYETWCDEVYTVSIQTSIDEPDVLLPTAYGLGQNYPNPFNPETMIPYQIPKSGHVRLRIYDMRGAAVRDLVDEGVQAGHHTAVWDGRDDRYSLVASGIYLVRIEAEGFVEQRKMILIR